MVANKRVRSKPLIRVANTATVVNGAQAAVNGMAGRKPNHGSTQVYLQQVSALHASGVLTDEEFSVVKQRLLGHAGLHPL
jgi:hypothetical protein